MSAYFPLKTPSHPFAPSHCFISSPTLPSWTSSFDKEAKAGMKTAAVTYLPQGRAVTCGAQGACFCRTAGPVLWPFPARPPVILSQPPSYPGSGSQRRHLANLSHCHVICQVLNAVCYLHMNPRVVIRRKELFLIPHTQRRLTLSIFSHLSSFSLSGFFLKEVKQNANQQGIPTWVGKAAMSY